MRWLSYEAEGFEATFRAFLSEPRGRGEDTAQAVAAILREVNDEGLSGVLRLTRQFDGLELQASEVVLGPEAIAAGAEGCPADVREALQLAARRIEAFHARQLPAAEELFEDAEGLRLGWRWSPLASAGLYSPGGRAAYPSTVLMNALPARIAGVERVVLATPARRLDPAVLAAAGLCGVSEIWRIGGAQAIAALAFGAPPLEPVDKIVGPGNAFVTEAKRQLFGRVGIDSLAGPSEVVIVADAAAEPAWIAADLLAQCEHDPEAQAILITDDPMLARAVASQVDSQLANLPTAEVAGAAWQAHGAVIIAPMDRVPALVDAIAPEHLGVAVAEPEALARRVRHAGAIFLGPYAPEALGDYTAGPNHVLPTQGAARYASGLSVWDFLKRTSIIAAEQRGLAALAPATACLAKAEGLPAHARSVLIRAPAC